MMEYTQLFGRVGEMRVAEAPGAYLKERVAAVAANLSLSGEVARQCAVINEALLKAVALLYEKDADGAWANVDCITYRIRVPMPWGSVGWRLWGLRQWEGRVLRSLLIRRAQVGQGAVRPALFDYNAEGNTWHLDVQSYVTPELATRFMQKESIKLGEWRRYARMFQEAEARRKKRHTS